METTKFVANNNTAAAPIPHTRRKAISPGASSNVPLCRSSPTKVKHDKFRATAIPLEIRIVINGSFTIGRMY